MIIFFGPFFFFFFLYEMSKLGVRPMRQCGLIAGKYGHIKFIFNTSMQIRSHLS